MKHPQLMSYLIMNKGLLSPKLKNKERMSIFTHQFNIIFLVLASVIIQQKPPIKQINKGIQHGRKIKTVLFSADIIVYVENMMEFIEKILELKSDFYNFRVQN